MTKCDWCKEEQDPEKDRVPAVLTLTYPNVPGHESFVLCETCEKMFRKMVKTGKVTK